jgi:hypothetical protein
MSLKTILQYHHYSRLDGESLQDVEGHAAYYHDRHLLYASKYFKISQLQ